MLVPCHPLLVMSSITSHLIPAGGVTESDERNRASPAGGE